jgi:hypothetical protein
VYTHLGGKLCKRMTGDRGAIREGREQRNNCQQTRIDQSSAFRERAHLLTTYLLLTYLLLNGYPPEFGPRDILPDVFVYISQNKTHRYLI